MNIVLTFDYEVFFGKDTGTIERSLLQPTDAICSIARRHGVRLVFFVDVGFILRMREEGSKHSSLMRDYTVVMKQLESLVRSGHELQLHVHPHWEDSHWNSDGWKIDTRRYRLHDFERAEIRNILDRYSSALRDITAGEAVFAYRAGGWVVQPFPAIRDELLEIGVRIESSVFPGGTSDSKTHQFDFSHCPAGTRWHFDHDPLVAVSNGPFLELPISSYKVSPTFYWRFALAKTLGRKHHRPCGDGSAIPLGRTDTLRRLLCPSTSVVSTDGYKATFLESAFRHYKNGRCADFVTIGHPKAASRYSLDQLDQFVARHKNENFVGYGAYRHLVS